MANAHSASLRVYCKQCSANFEVSPKDLEFYKQMKVIPPTCCPPCRQQRRLAFRNERNLYKRNCDMCGKSVVTVYSPDKNFAVYCKDCWWSDKWDAEKYGRDFDFNRSFFEQFEDLMKDVPRLALINVQHENSDYTNYGYMNKDCYLVYTSDENEKCYYGAYIWDSVGCFDCLYVLDSKYSYGCVDCINVYESQNCRMCEACQTCCYCYDCRNCSDCFGCVGLRHKQYYFLNEKLKKAEYEKRMNEVLSDKKALKDCLKKYGELMASLPRKAVFQVNCQDCVGNYIKNSKNLYWCFDGRGAEDAKWGTNLSTRIYHCYDMDGCGWIEWSAEGICNGLDGTNHCFAADHLWNGNYEVFYSSYCMGGHDLFGCIGLKHQNYCILNKKYSKEEYEKLREKIVEHMKKTAEFGEFFPIVISPFAYNETLAWHQYPLSKKEILDKGWRWKDDDKRDFLPQSFVVPEKIEDVGENILKEILACEKCKKNFKIIAQELKYLRKWSLSVPKKCPECRHKERDALRMPRNLWKRKCDKCAMEIWSGYEIGCKEKVYCEKCYLQIL